MIKAIKINNQQIEIIDYNIRRLKIDGRDILTVTISKENISAGDLDILCSEIEANAPVITVTEDEETVQTLTGFRLHPIFGLCSDRTSWELKIENESELAFQYGLLKQRADELEKANADQARVIESQGAIIAEQTETINDQAIAIYNQGQRISDQDIMIANQTVTISEQNATITSQGEKISAQEEQLALQAEEMTLLNDTLLEMLLG